MQSLIWPTSSLLLSNQVMHFQRLLALGILAATQVSSDAITMITYCWMLFTFQAMKMGAFLASLTAYDGVASYKLLFKWCIADACLLALLPLLRIPRSAHSISCIRKSHQAILKVIIQLTRANSADYIILHNELVIIRKLCSMWITNSQFQLLTPNFSYH